MNLAYLLAESGLMIIIFLLAVLVMALCMVAMAVGLILQNKTFTSCGRAGIDYRGERIDCSVCVSRESNEERADVGEQTGCRVRYRS